MKYVGIFGKDYIVLELDYKAIGKRIKIARIKQNLTQETVADRIGVTPQHISNVETGNTSVSLPTLIAIANTLHHGHGWNSARHRWQIPERAQ